jgi:nicotinate-nucleotide pyrophosphorylase (carboxylating)
VAPTLPARASIDADVRRALAEDLGSGDATAALVPQDTQAIATITARESGVLAGSAWAQGCFEQVDPRLRVEWMHADGARFEADTVLCRISGPARGLLSAERSALNFLQTLSGCATTTAAYVAAVAGSGATILDTRKTLPGLRLAQKYAVRCGGAGNQRLGLYDAVLIKENHIACAGSIGAAIRAARLAAPGLPLEVEVESLEEFAQALLAAPDRIMLDDFSLPQVRAAVELGAGRVPLEVSGGVALDTVDAIAATGVDFISVGALTKHVRAIDLSLRIELRD